MYFPVNLFWKVETSKRLLKSELRVLREEIIKGHIYQCNTDDINSQNKNESIRTNVLKTNCKKKDIYIGMDRIQCFFIIISFIIRGIDCIQVPRCPVGLDQWKERQHTLKCDSSKGHLYTCVKSTMGHFWEQCRYVFRIAGGKTCLFV